MNDSAAELVTKNHEAAAGGASCRRIRRFACAGDGVDTLVSGAEVLRDRGVHSIELIFVGDRLEKESLFSSPAASVSAAYYSGSPCPAMRSGRT